MLRESDQHQSSPAALQDAPGSRAGKVPARYRDINNRLVVLVFDSQELHDEHMSFQKRMGRLPGTEPPAPFAPIAEAYKLALRKEPTNGNRVVRARLVERFIEPHFREHFLPEVTGPELELFRAELLKQVSGAVAQRALRELEIIFEELIEDKVVEHQHDPFLSMRRQLTDVTPIIAARMRRNELASSPLPTRSQLDLILATARDWVRIAVHLIVYAGLRGQEVRALQWKHILLDQGIITVLRAVKRHSKDFGVPKSPAGRRDIKMEEPLLRLLRSIHPGPGHEEEFVILKDLKPITHAQLYHAVHRVQIDAGYARSVRARGTNYRYTGSFGPHLLRHACVALWLWNKKSHADVVREIGHGDLKMTYDVYGYLFDASRNDQLPWPSGDPGESVSTKEQIRFECETW